MENIADLVRYQLKVEDAMVIVWKDGLLWWYQFSWWSSRIGHVCPIVRWYSTKRRAKRMAKDCYVRMTGNPVKRAVWVKVYVF